MAERLMTRGAHWGRRQGMRKRLLATVANFWEGMESLR